MDEASEKRVSISAFQYSGSKINFHVLPALPIQGTY